MQKNSPELFRIFSRSSVQGVSDQRMPYMAHVNPYLMRSARQNMTLDKSVPAAAPQNPELRYGFFPVGIDGHTQPVA